MKAVEADWTRTYELEEKMVMVQLDFQANQESNWILFRVPFD